MADGKGNGAEWITIKEAVKRLPMKVSESTVRRWVDENRYGIVSGRFAGRVVVRADSLPDILKHRSR